MQAKNKNGCGSPPTAAADRRPSRGPWWPAVNVQAGGRAGRGRRRGRAQPPTAAAAGPAGGGIGRSFAAGLGRRINACPNWWRLWANLAADARTRHLQNLKMVFMFLLLTIGKKARYLELAKPSPEHLVPKNGNAQATAKELRSLEKVDNFEQILQTRDFACVLLNSYICVTVPIKNMRRGLFCVGICFFIKNSKHEEILMVFKCFLWFSSF